MDNQFKEFEQRVNRSLTEMKAQISALHQTTGTLKESFDDFDAEMIEFMKFMAEHVSDHEDRLKRIEKHLDLE